MKKFAFISRHVPTVEQIALAAKLDIELVHVGDRDAFTGALADLFSDRLKFDGACVVHPAAALRVAGFYQKPVLVFENGNRAAEGQPPKFYAKAAWLHTLSSHNQVDRIYLDVQRDSD